MSKRVSVKITTLKAKLSEYVKKARKGQEVLVYDREVPVVLLVPYKVDQPFHLEVIQPQEDPESFCKIEGKKVGKGKVTSLEVLIEDRNSRS